MLGTLEPGDRLLVSELSRLGRSLSQVIQIVETLVRRKIRFIAIKEAIEFDGKQDLSTKVMIALFGLFAEVERDLISERTKEGLAAAKAKGKRLGRPKGALGTSRLDGLLYHESDLRIEEHYTDTTGFTDHVFALMHLLGFRFAPRIRDLADKRLYIHGDTKRYPTLARLIGGSVNVKRIRAHWDAILRLAASIQQGTVTASLMLRKLGSYPRQNGLALALRELGRIERTLFTLDWLQDIELRRRVQIGLNKGEAKNALARAVFFNRLGELRDRSFENQRYRASGLNLVVAAIVLWNTAYLERVVQALRDIGNTDDSLLPHLSPLGWEHINLTGDYSWQQNKQVEQGNFRPLPPLTRP